jgi:hypothetical protein
LVAAQGFALAVETKEAGPIAFRVSAEGRAMLRESLAELDSFASGPMTLSLLTIQEKRHLQQPKQSGRLNSWTIAPRD